MPAGKGAAFSIVIPARDEGVWVRRTVEAVLSTCAGHDVEVVVVDDGSTDGSCDFLRQGLMPDVRLILGGGLGVARARNRGAAEARGDNLIFLDAHVLPDPGWIEAIAALLEDPSVGLAGVGVRDYENPLSVGYSCVFVDERLQEGWAPRPETDAPFEVPCIIGCCVGVRRDLFESMGRFDPGHVRWGVEDIELSLRAWHLGYRCLVSPRAQVDHYFKHNKPRNFHVSWTDYDINLLRFALTYFSGRRLASIIAAARSRPNFEESLLRAAGDAAFWDRREGLRRRFVRDEEWFFRRFATEFAPFERRLREIALTEAGPRAEPASVQPRPSQSLSETPSVSVVIASRNEGDWPQRTIEAMKSASAGHRLEIIVVDDGSEDGSCERLAERAGGDIQINIFRCNGVGVARARNLGAAAAAGDVLVFADAHVLPDAGWLDEAAGLLQDDSVGLVGFAVRDLEEPRSVGHGLVFADENLQTAWVGGGDRPFDAPCVHGCCVAVRRAVFEEIGGFLPFHRRWGADDVELSLRAWRFGYRCVVTPRVQVGHYFKHDRPRPDPVTWEEYDTNILALALTYFSGDALGAVLGGLRKRRTLAASLAYLAESGFLAWRDGLQEKFVRDEGWLFARFADEMKTFEDRVRELAMEEAQAMVTQRRQKCPQCGATNIGTQTQCMLCRAPLPEGDAMVPSPVRSSAAARACTSCGAALSGDAKFCVSCGTPVPILQQPAAAPVQPPPQPALQQQPTPPAVQPPPQPAQQQQPSPPAALPNTSSCVRCGAALTERAQFCVTCGTPVQTQPLAPAPAAPPVRACARCGARLVDGSRFCVTCGAPA